MTPSKLILVRGASGSGKSTYARSLGIPDHFEADMWFHRGGTYAYDPTMLPEAHGWCLDQATKAMEAGRDVVVANTFTRLWEMATYKEVAERLGITVEEVTMTGTYQNVHGVPEDRVRN